MKVVITGGAGFIGLQLARQLLQRGVLVGGSGRSEPIAEVVLFDRQFSANLPDMPVGGPQLCTVQGDIADRDVVSKLIDRPDISVFHLASIVSAGAEQDFDLAMQVNLTGHLNVLEALRKVGCAPRYVFASSIAVYGGDSMPAQVDDLTRQVPQTTYGATKAIGELLLNDYSRKGFVDGRGARLGMVLVRPGQPNRAASGFGSSMIREPLNGIDCVVPVPLDTRVAVIGYRTVIDGLIALHDVDGARLGTDRTLNLPATTASLEELIQSLQRVAAGLQLGSIRCEVDADVVRIVAGWPSEIRSQRAALVGLPRDADLDSIIRAYMDDYVPRGQRSMSSADSR